jgi:hypothetical protein
MSEGLPRPDKEELKAKPEQNTSGAEGRENKPCCSSGGKIPEHEGKSCKHNESESGWSKGGEMLFKVVELAAFIAVLLTFLEMRKTRIDDERAWINIANPTFGSAFTATNLELAVQLRNSGKTPALINSITIDVWDSNLAFTQTNFVHKFNIGTAIVAPNDSSPCVATTVADDATFHLMINNKIYRIWCYTVVYADIFGHTHHTRTCLMTTGAFGPSGFFLVKPNSGWMD